MTAHAFMCTQARTAARAPPPRAREARHVRPPPTPTRARAPRVPAHAAQATRRCTAVAAPAGACWQEEPASHATSCARCDDGVPQSSSRARASRRAAGLTALLFFPRGSRGARASGGHTHARQQCNTRPTFGVASAPCASSWCGSWCSPTPRNHHFAQHHIDTAPAGSSGGVHDNTPVSLTRSMAPARPPSPCAAARPTAPRIGIQHFFLHVTARRRACCSCTRSCTKHARLSSNAGLRPPHTARCAVCVVRGMQGADQRARVAARGGVAVPLR